MSQIKSKVELMAPAGSYESLMAAINAGCDSVFFGITQLNMRAKAAANFTFDDLKQIAVTCHKHKVKAYLTLNTLLYDHDINLAKKIIDACKEHGIDAVICADMAAISYANEVGVPVHISTQLSIANIEGVKFYAQFSDTVVLARELTVPMIKKIVDQIKEQDIRGRSGNLLQIEVFGHGAMCIAVSGRCSMSLITDNSSANRGACRQNCRRSYKVIDEETNTALRLENDYVLSPSDLCTIGLLDELIDTGIAVLKIEGRGRSPDYVDRVIRAYREALDSIEAGTYTQEKIEQWNKQMRTVFNRGHSHGFYLGKSFVEWSGVSGNKATKKRVQIGVVTKFYPKLSVAEVNVETNTLTTKDEYIITGNTTGIVRGQKPELWLDEQQVEQVTKGDMVTFKVKDRVRRGDRLYKLVDA